MGPGSAQRKRKVVGEEADSRWEQVIGKMDELIGVKVKQMRIRERASGLKGKGGELSEEEAKRLPEAAGYAARLRDALESGNIRKIDKVA